MAAGIEENDGIMYVGATPWHGIGKQLPALATSAEAIEAAGLDWRVETVPVYIDRMVGTILRQGVIAIPNQRAVVRQDTREVFQIASDRYTPLQNADAFQFMDGLVTAGEAAYEVAGSLGNGRKVWMLVRLPGELALGDDRLNKYILLSNSHDGSAVLDVRFTAVRVVCRNTMNLALSDTGAQRFTARHTTNLLTKVNEAREVLNLGDAYFAMMMRGVERLAETRLTLDDVDAFVANLFEVKDSLDIGAPTERAMKAVAHGFLAGTGTTGQTAWDAFNGVTEYVDFQRPTRGGNGTRRLENAWYGGGAALKQRAWDLLLN